MLKLSDRVAAMYEGEMMVIVQPSKTRIEEIGHMMGGMRLEQIRMPHTRRRRPSSDARQTNKRRQMFWTPFGACSNIYCRILYLTML